MFNPHLFQVFLRPSFGAYAPPSPDLTFYAYAFLRRVGRLPATFQILSDDLSRHCVPLSPKGKAFYPGICAPLSPKGKAFYPGIRVSLSPKGKAFYPGICAPLSPKGKAFYPGICVPLSPKGKAVIGTASHSPRRGKPFYILC